MPRISPRVPLVDVKGFITREWYRYFFENETDIAAADANINSSPSVQEADFSQVLDEVYSTPSTQEADFSQVLDEVYSVPIVSTDSLAVSLSAMQSLIPLTVPVTKTADFTVDYTEQWLINNKSGSTCTVTLPNASEYAGRVLSFQNYQAQLLVSASSDVVPQAGGAAGTSILAATAGKWATLVSNGTNWVITQSN